MKTTIKKKRKSIWKDMNSWELLLLCMPALIGYLLFNYVPTIVSISIPFRDYKFAKGILGSEFVGFYNFKWLFASDLVGRAVRNTVLYGLWFMIVEPVTNIFVALILFELKSRKSLKVYQTIMTFPNFMSMVVVSYITYAVLSPSSGLLNQILEGMGAGRIDAYVTPKLWPLILTLVQLWKGLGMGVVMYFASLMGVDPSLFEAAEIDGATRFQRIRYISIPHVVPLACIFTILNAGKLINGNFDLFYLIPKNVNVLYSTTDILNTYVYRALKEGSYSMGATVGLVQSVVGLILVLGANLIVKKISPENSMF